MRALQGYAAGLAPAEDLRVVLRWHGAAAFDLLLFACGGAQMPYLSRVAPAGTLPACGDADLHVQTLAFPVTKAVPAATARGQS